ncbi:NDR1/HIN1-like protein 1 [Lycium ferocissimum]|uniref:NDR1/HIN1-like protein 1 n=1 Tax=Lycium ferocissimum TaxID=112874 RepID=UPI002815D6A3|nr:NDR1/HIN1-like protein 1 [Lycium ferocissimum]
MNGHDPKKNPSHKNPVKTLCTFLLILLILAGLVVLIGWLIYRPHEPNFSLVGAAIYELNVTSPPYMSSIMQFTVLARNPNRRVRLDYDQFSALVYYKDQAITPPAMLPPLLQETKSTAVLSPVIRSALVPVSVEAANGLLIDEVYGVVALRLVFLGKMRYKAAFVRTKHYGLYVNCDMLVGYKKGFVGQVPLLGTPDCQVDL